jgi:hypothetical protein
MSGYVLRSLFHAGHAFPMVVVVTFEAERLAEQNSGLRSLSSPMYLDARLCFNALDMSGYVLRSLFHTRHAFPVVVIVTFEAQAG